MVTAAAVVGGNTLSITVRGAACSQPIKLRQPQAIDQYHHHVAMPTDAVEQWMGKHCVPKRGASEFAAQRAHQVEQAVAVVVGPVNIAAVIALRHYRLEQAGVDTAYPSIHRAQ
ncbi:hypothetical protein [Chitinolyticbacter albus]|uniref:hypothetical protein n=1 Tax=Chitinolyticbacter albus TaxID=2961951 RepID=UPI0021099870|nr:hypothetical protein [Chitinolyticbacter albus]